MARVRPTLRDRNHEFAREGEVPFSDRTAASPTGRQREPADLRSPDELPLDDDEAGEAQPGEMEPDERWKSTRTRPVSERTFDRGETTDGLDETEEAVRRQAEDHPLGLDRQEGEED